MVRKSYRHANSVLSTNLTFLTGMGNRFRDLPEYHTLIKGHAILAVITFLLVVPAAITIARFYYSRPRLALKLHIGLHIITVFLVTVVLILGWFAVGPERSLTNPHHGIGVAIYTLILIQAIGGAMVHRIEKGKVRYKLPLKLMIHQWLGRAIALLGIAQIPLGLTLYGSPKVLFILYALAVALWLFIWFTLSYRYQGGGDIGSDYGYGSYVSRRSGPTATEITENQPPRREGSHWLRDTALVGGAIAGLAAFRDRSKRRREERLEMREERINVERPQGQPVPGHMRQDRSHSGVSHPLPPPGQSRPPSGSYIEEEKISEYSLDEKPRHTWRNRFLGAGAGLGAYEGLKRVFYGQNRRDEESDLGSYGAPLGGNQSLSRTDVSRVQSGQAPFSPGDARRSHRPSRVQIASPMASPTRPGVADASRPTLTEASGPSLATPVRLTSRLRRNTSVSSFDSQDSFESRPQHQPGLTTGQGVAAGLGTAGGLFGLREWNRRRKERKEDRRLEEIRRMDEENAERISRVNSQRRRNRLSTEQPLTEDNYETGADDYAMTGSNPALSRRNHPNTNAPPLPAAAAAIPPSTVRQSDSDAICSPPLRPDQPAYPVGTSAVSIPTGPVESNPSRLMDTSRHDTRSHHAQDAVAGVAGASAGAALADHHNRRRHSHDHTASTVSASPQTQTSQPVSVKVKIHDDNRHITLRRLNSEEAAAEREARRRERRTRRRRASSLSSGVEDDTPRFRRQGRPPVSNESRPISDVPPIPIQQQYKPSPELNLPPAPAPVPQPQVQPPRMQAQAQPPYPVGPGLPPPVPMHSSPHGAGVVSPATVNSGGYETGTGTEMSAFDDNRRRRRAERAAVKQRLAGQGARVEFT